MALAFNSMAEKRTIGRTDAKQVMVFVFYVALSCVIITKCSACKQLPKNSFFYNCTASYSTLSIIRELYELSASRIMLSRAR